MELDSNPPSHEENSNEAVIPGQSVEQNSNEYGDELEGRQDGGEEEVVVKMEDAEAEDMAHDATDIKVEVEADVPKPARKTTTEMNAAFRATESDDALRNIDVILRLRTLSFPTVADWILNHKCCPQIYKDKAQTDEGKIVL